MDNTFNINKIDKFLQFGCWNNTNKDKKGNVIGNLLGVMSSVTNYIINESVKPDFIVIAGDNYYPQKKKPSTPDEKKKKIIYTQKLIDGFQNLPKGIEIDMILGNHDLETNTKKPTLYIDGEIEVEKGDCYILNQEEKIEKTLIIEGNPINLFLYKEKMLSNGSLLLMIDTSMYSTDAILYLKCYNHLLTNQNKNPVTNVEELILLQNNFILSTISKYSTNIKNLVIIGHHPIIGIKSKETIDVLDDIPEFINTLKMINDTIKTNVSKPVNFYYLCADLHLYQSGIIVMKNLDNTDEMIINQYIVGTGGTELDNPIPLDKIKYANGIPIKYNRQIGDKTMEYMVTDCIQDFGFLECIMSEKPSFTFIPTSYTNSTGNIISTGKSGGKKSLKKRKHSKKGKSKKTKTKKRK